MVTELSFLGLLLKSEFPPCVQWSSRVISWIPFGKGHLRFGELASGNRYLLCPSCRDYDKPGQGVQARQNGQNTISCRVWKDWATTGWDRKKKNLQMTAKTKMDDDTPTQEHLGWKSNLSMVCRGQKFDPISSTWHPQPFMVLSQENSLPQTCQDISGASKISQVISKEPFFFPSFFLLILFSPHQWNKLRSLRATWSNPLTCFGFLELFRVSCTKEKHQDMNYVLTHLPQQSN